MATIRKTLTAVGTTLTVLVLLANTASAQMPQTTTDKTKGTPSVTTQELTGEVVHVEGNDLVVQMPGGELRIFHTPASRRFVVDGKELTVGQLKPGTRLTATVTTTTTPVTVRTTTVGSGKVWYVSGKNVILTLPNGENKQYVVSDDAKFVVNGNPATVYELRKGMTVSAEKIVEEPATEIASDTRVVGTAPRAAATSTAASSGASSGAASGGGAAGAGAPTLPKTASPLPLVGLAGLLSIGASLGLRMLRRR